MKPSKSKYPALPEPVKNLLTLHGLEARVLKQREFTSRGTRRVPHWEVFYPRKVTPGAFGHDLRVRALLFTISSRATVDEWVDVVGRWSRGEPVSNSVYSVDFETYSTSCPETFSANSQRYTKMLREMVDARALLSGLPSKTR